MAATQSRTVRAIRWTKPVAIVAAMFGVATLFSGGSVLFGPAEAQRAAGNYMPFVVWFNFLAGSLYVVAAIGIWLRQGWAFGVAAFIAVTTFLIALVFGYQIVLGETFETRTIGALSLRTGFWTAIAIALKRTRHPN